MRLFAALPAMMTSVTGGASPTGRSRQVATRRSAGRLIAAARDAAALDGRSAALADAGEGGTDHIVRLLTTAPTIEQAKGVVMGYYGIDADAAFAVLRRWSSHRNVKLSCVAEELVTAAARPGARPFAGIEQFLTAIEPVAGADGAVAHPRPHRHPDGSPRRPIEPSVTPADGY